MPSQTARSSVATGISRPFSSWAREAARVASVANTGSSQTALRAGSIRSRCTSRRCTSSEAMCRTKLMAASAAAPRVLALSE